MCLSCVHFSSEQCPRLESRIFLCRRRRFDDGEPKKKIVCVIITIRPQQVTFVGALYEFSKMILFNIIATKCTSQLNLQPSAKRHSMIFFFAIHRLTTQAVEPVSGESRDPKKPRSTRDFDRENHRKNIFFIFIHSYTISARCREKSR